MIVGREIITVKQFVVIRRHFLAKKKIGNLEKNDFFSFSRLSSMMDGLPSRRVFFFTTSNHHIFTLRREERKRSEAEFSEAPYFNSNGPRHSGSAGGRSDTK
jgi:hypothetical protein